MQGYLLWEAPEGSLSILVRRSLLGRLKQLAEEAFSRECSESNGVLVGRSEDLIESGRRVITIDGFESGMSRLRDGAAVGFLRFRRQQELHLSEADFLVLRAGIGLVCLMVRPDGTRGAKGGFFYREEKTVQCPPAEMQFVIDPGSPDCRTLPRHESDDDDQPAAAPTRTKRLVYAAVGLALLVSPAVFWFLNG